MTTSDWLNEKREADAARREVKRIKASGTDRDGRHQHTWKVFSQIDGRVILETADERATNGYNKRYVVHLIDGIAQEHGV